MKKMKKKNQNLILLVFVFVCNFSYGQNNMEDVVYLKNGSINRGIIIEQAPNQNIKIQTKDRNVFVFKYKEIEKMTKENLPTDTNNNSKVTELKKSGFINLTEINYSHGIGDVKVGNNTVKNNDYFLGFRTVNGYLLNEHLSLGIGIGIDKYKNAILLPITFDARATILKGQVSPVFTANVGYAVGLNDIKAGLVINPQIGIKTYISKNVVYFLNIGYKWQAQEEIYYSDTFTYVYPYYFSKTENVYFKFITISAGFAF
jgi:hypothetical protein